MRKQHVVAALCVAVSLAACGGGGGGKGKKGSGAPAPSAPAPAATVSVAVSSAPVSQNIDYGDDFSTSLDGTWSGSNLGGAAVYLQVTDSANTFTMPPVQAAPVNNMFHYPLNAITNVQAGDRTGTLTVRACKDSACSQTYTDASASVTYRLQVAAVGEWETIQRDATHNGYVPVSLDPARFARSWEWTFQKDAAAVRGFLGRPATGSGAMFIGGGNFAADNSSYGHVVQALDESTGIVKWTQPLTGYSLAPAAAYGAVYSVTRDSNTLLTAFDAGTGALKFKYAQTTLPDAAVLAPTLFGGNAYFFAGANGNEIHAANATTGGGIWSRARIGLQPTTPAVDANHVYYQADTTLQILDRATGNAIAIVTDPASDGARPPSSSAPVLGSRGNVIVNSYNATTRVHKLTSFNIANRQWEWSSQNSYQVLPAVAGGVVYALRRATSVPTLDALDEATGSVLWSWSPPAADGQTYAINNVVATRNLVFVNTTNDTGPGFLWAIDLATRQAAWRYPEAGYTVISASRMLYQLPDASVGQPRIVAIKLR